MHLGLLSSVGLPFLFRAITTRSMWGHTQAIGLGTILIMGINKGLTRGFTFNICRLTTFNTFRIMILTTFNIFTNMLVTHTITITTHRFSCLTQNTRFFGVTMSHYFASTLSTFSRLFGGLIHHRVAILIFRRCIGCRFTLLYIMTRVFHPQAVDFTHYVLHIMSYTLCLTHCVLHIVFYT